MTSTGKTTRCETFLLTAPSDVGKVRLDRWLAQELPDFSRSRLAALLESGAVVENGIAVRSPSRPVKPGATYRLDVPQAAPAEPEAQAIPLNVVYEDADVIVIDKPAGMVVHPAPGSPDATLVNALLAHCGESLSGIGGVKRPGIVHRLDKDTSGLMVAAKNDRAHHALAEQFAAHSLERVYQAIVWGVPSPTSGQIEGQIGRSPTNRKKMAVLRSGGKYALTRYKVLRVLAGGAASLVECRLATGRTHQIRVHMTSIGHPLVGDSTYGGRRLAPKSIDESAKSALLSFPRQALHALVIGFIHPTSGESLHFSGLLPFDINALLDILE
ncbi:MAG: RNA pseudouridine synthase [Alphaproteobacteria bacterium RIFOXYD12_FULL_60_8]|nr:MAG: RNA pseudouridine synthase [Alphaproteobacteria bacterium RIFOXYD12_FULL_60_8]